MRLRSGVVASHNKSRMMKFSKYKSLYIEIIGGNMNRGYRSAMALFHIKYILEVKKKSIFTQELKPVHLNKACFPKCSMNTFK